MVLVDDKRTEEERRRNEDSGGPAVAAVVMTCLPAASDTLDAIDSFDLQVVSTTEMGAVWRKLCTILSLRHAECSEGIRGM